MAEKAIRDYTTIGDVKEFITNQIAPNYFPDIDDVSKLNVGLFGMVVDINSTGLFDNMQVTSRYITEIVPGKSRLPEFIYANANNFGITNLFSQCAKTTVMIMVKESDVINNGTIVGRYSDYYISDDCIIYIDDIPFSIPYPIRIRSKLINGAYNHYCTYDQRNNNSIVKLNNPFVRCVKTHVVNEPNVYLALTVDVYQYVKVVHEENIVTNNILNIPYIDITHSEQMCNFEAYYKAPEDSNYTQLEKFLETTPATNRPFTYYKLIDENTYRISFSNDDRYFVPEFNSELKIVTFETLGEKGTFKIYDGDNVYVSTVDNNVPLHAAMVVDSVGGDDAYTLEEVRRLTWEKQLTINSYTTDYDLNSFFTLNYRNYDTKALFIKIRDDFATRIFACYTRLKDEDNIFPTNTLNADIFMDCIDTTYSSQDKYIIDAGARFVYSDDETRTKCTIIPDDAPVPADGIEYTNIALMSITTSPNTLGFYMNSIDKNLLMEYRFLNDDSLFQFIVKTLNVKRNAVRGDKEYVFTMTILPSDLTLIPDVVDSSVNAGAESNDLINDGLVDPVPEETELELKFDPTKIKVYAYFPAPTSGAHFVEFTYDEENSSNKGYVFTGVIKTDDMISESKIQLIDITYNGEDNLSDVCSVDMRDPNMSFMVFYDEGVAGLNQYEDVLTDTAGYTLCNIYNAAEGEMYFAYPMSLIESTVAFTEIDLDGYTEFVPGQYYEEGDNVYVVENDTKYPWCCHNSGAYEDVTPINFTKVDRFYFYVKNIPLFGREFLLDEENMKEALARLNDYYSYLQRVMLDITANFALSLRFFNTYGRSSTFTISNGLGSSETLNRTNSDIWLSIMFTPNANITDIIPDVKDTVKKFIESISADDARTGINSVSMSYLMKQLHDTYVNEIEYVIFNSFNGYDSSYQNIIMNYDLTAVENCRMIPEFITLDAENIRITILNDDV